MKPYHRLAIVLAVAAATGCRPSGPQIVPVSGKLTHKGQPLANVEVYFWPTQGRNSVGLTDAEGKFTLGYSRDQQGALVGTHTVFVSYVSPTADPSPPPPEIRDVIARYGTVDKSTKKVEITKAVDDLVIDLE